MKELLSLQIAVACSRVIFMITNLAV